MYDSTLHAKTLARQIRKTDFEPGLLQIQLAQKPSAIARAVEVANAGFQSVALRRANIAGREVFQQSSLPEALITRHISENIRRVTNVRQGDRQSIVNCVRSLVSEGTAFNVLKLDIKSFYESVDPGATVKKLRNDAAFSRQSVEVLDSFFRSLQQQGVRGFPRGLELSATLAEYVMRDFDRAVSHLSGVRFYSRYVDDIFILTSPAVQPADIIYDAGGNLPEGLSFRRTKTRVCQFNRQISANPTVQYDFTFLGYCIKVTNILRSSDGLRRQVDIDIAPAKVRKIKRRIALAILDYNNGGSFADLHDRIKILTSNYEFYDNRTGARRLAGIRYNYALIDPRESGSLAALDLFLYNALYSNNPKNRLRPTLSYPQRRCLWGYSFTSGFRSNRFFTFSQNDLHRITRCWSHA